MNVKHVATILASHRNKEASDQCAGSLLVRIGKLASVAFHNNSIDL